MYITAHYFAILLYHTETVSKIIYYTIIINMTISDLYAFIQGYVFKTDLKVFTDGKFLFCLEAFSADSELLQRRSCHLSLTLIWADAKAA